MNQAIKGDIWLTYYDQRILVKTNNKRYQIKDENTIRALTHIIPELKQRTISTKQIVTVEHPQLESFINKFIGPTQSNHQVDNPNFEFINFMEEKEINTTRLVSILSKISPNQRIVVVIPVQSAPYIFIGNAGNIIGFILANHLSVGGEEMTIFKPMNLQKSIQYCLSEALNTDNLSIFYMNEHEPERFTKVNILKDISGTIGEIGEKEAFHFEPIEFFHEPINSIKKFIKQTPYLFSEYGYSNLKQIPFKVAMLKSMNDDKELTTIASTDHPLKSLYEAFKLGMGSFLNLYMNEGEENLSKWVCCSNEEDVYLNGILPLVFQYYEEYLPDQLEQSQLLLADIEISSNIINSLLSIHETDLLAKKIEVSILKLKDYRMFQVQMIVDGYIQATQFGTNIKLLLENTIQQFYAKYIQNKFPYDQINKKVHQYKQKPWIDMFSDEVTISSEELKKVREKNRLTVTYSPWKYNDILTETKTKCLKISLSKKGNN